MANKTDEQVVKLMAEVGKQKAEITKAEKPNWITNCSFSYSENGGNPTNLHVESNVRSLVSIAAFLLNRQASYDEAAKRLGVIDAPEFVWGGSKVADWLEDIKTRISKVQIAARKSKLEKLESRLSAIVSPDLKAKMELEAIEKDLG